MRDVDTSYAGSELCDNEASLFPVWPLKRRASQVTCHRRPVTCKLDAFDSLSHWASLLWASGFVLKTSKRFTKSNLSAK